MRSILQRAKVATFSLSILFAICEPSAAAAEVPLAEGSRDKEDGASVQPLPELVDEPYTRLDLPSQEFRADIYPEDEDYLPAFDAGADLLIYGPPNGFGVSQSRRAAAIPAYRAHVSFNATNGLGAKVTWWALNSPYSTGQLTGPNGQLASSLNLSELRAEAAYTTLVGSGDLSFSGGFALVSLATISQLDQQRSFVETAANTPTAISDPASLGGVVSSSPPPMNYRSRLAESYSIAAPGFTLGVTGRQRLGAMRSAWVLASLQWTNVFGDARYSSNYYEWVNNFDPLWTQPRETAFNQLSLFGVRLGPSWTKEFDNGVTLAWSATMEAEIVTQLGLNGGPMRAEGSMVGMGANFGLAR